MFTTLSRYVYRLSRGGFFGPYLLCMLILLCAGPLFAASDQAPGKRVVFLPFSVNVPGSYAYLENGLSSILKSRLAARADIIPVTSDENNKSLLTSLQKNRFEAFSRELAQTKADYIILGSLDAETGGYAITAYVFGKKMDKGLHKFEQSISSIDGAMTAMDSLSWDISEEVFGRKKPALAGNTVDTSSGVTAFHTSHPDRTYREGLLSSARVDFIHDGQFSVSNTYRSQKIFADIVDLNIDDLEGDGTDEILLLSNTTLYIYHLVEGAYSQLAEIPVAAHLRLHSVTTADLDNNGVKELYVSGNNGKNAYSTIIEFQNGTTHKLAENIPYYLSVVEEQGKPVLYGQKSGIKWPYGGPKFRLQRKAWDQYLEQEQVSLSKNISIYDFRRTDLNNDGSLETIVITPANRLQVLNNQGEVLWESQDQYGTGRNFFGTLYSNDENDVRPVYIKTRIITQDLNQDGADDVILVRNRIDHVPFMPRLRYFDGSSITAMTWQDGRLKPLWETQRIPGYIINTQVRPQPNNQFQLIFGEAETSYPFVFWQASALTLNSYTFKGTPASPKEKTE